MRGLTRAMRKDHPMLQEKLGAPGQPVVGAPRCEPEDRAPRLVEGRMRRFRPYVAVSAAVRPLRLDERLGQDVEPRVAAQAEVEALVERTTLR
jgi:hypothetical protein